jgi:VWFA-related protein
MRLILRSCRFRAILFLLLASPVFPQGLTESIDVSIINVDVFVTDAKGNRVHGLTRDDFEIRENGRRQPITNFAEFAPRVTGSFAVEGTAPDATPATAPTPAPAAKRTIVMFVEVARQPSERVRELFAGLRQFVKTAVRPGDAVSIVAFRQKLATDQKFTDDVEALNAALAKLEEESIGATVDVRDVMRRARTSDAGGGPPASANGLTAQGERISVEALERKAAASSELSVMRRKTAAMTSVMESISGVEGRKIMVLALQKYGLRPGFEHAAERSVPMLTMDPFVERLRQAVMRTANAHGITLYPLHTPGYRWASNGTAEEERVKGWHWGVDSDDDLARFGSDNNVQLNQTASLDEIAKETGGLMASGPADIVELLPRIADDLESYYSLAYRATPNRDGSRRKVVVTVKNRDYTVRSRRAVVEKSSDTQMDDRVVSNLFHPFEGSKIPIRVETGALTKNGRKKWSLPVVVRVPLGALTTIERDGTAAGSFTVFIATGGDIGTLSEVVRRTQPYAMKLQEAETVRRGDFTFNATIEVDHQADAISIGVRDDLSQEFGLVRAALQ